MTTPVQGYISLILHAHLPYVRHTDRDDYMEERWFFEAMTETYLPLLQMFDRLSQDGIPFRLTISLSPPLLAMMDDALMAERYTAYLEQLIALAALEQERTREQPEFHTLAVSYYERFTSLLSYYQGCDQRIIPKFRTYQDMGAVEIMTCSATHAFLPYLKHRQSMRAQLEVGVKEYERHFGRKPRGIWLPECAYTQQLSPLLKACGIQYFILDQHGIEHAVPKPSRGLAAPIMTIDGVHAFARDPESSRQVWSSHEGYPGDPDYREYYRDIGYDLGWNDAEEWEYIKPFLLSDGARIHTGMKYYRISGKHEEKQPYNEKWARSKASKHADHFLYCREQQLTQLAAHCDRKPIVVSPYDAELFGHWWHEGPLWIEELFRNNRTRRGHVAFITPSDYIREYPIAEIVDLSFCSWGRNGYGEVWLQQNNDWIYRHLHAAEDRLIQTLESNQHQLWGHTQIVERILNQAVRELMLAESSDWAFIIDAQTVPSYAVNRTMRHLSHVHQLLEMVDEHVYDVAVLEELEHAHACLPSATYHLYTADSDLIDSRLAAPMRGASSKAKTRKVLMLAWEFPPLVVGGLAKAVYDLSRYLALQGMEVHVLTREVQGSPAYEILNQIHVHRVSILQSTTQIDFMDWVFQLNLAIADYGIQLMDSGHTFDYLHAHDWLVYYAAKDMKEYARIPLISTIHATEYGRNHGRIEQDIQRQIHQMETELTALSDQVIVCSRAMMQEVQQLFSLPEAKVSMIPNGVEIADAHASLERMQHAMQRSQYADQQEPIIFYIGRLVYEKGIQVLIEALPKIREAVPHAKLIIAGSGPMKQALQQLVAEKNLTSCVHFTGFVNDDERNVLLHMANVCVFPSLYEPFGIVALEAMQSGTPVVVSDTGGLSEIIEHGVDGYKAIPGHTESLAWHVSEALLHPEASAQMAKKAVAKVQERYDWNSIALETHNVYKGVMLK